MSDILNMKSGMYGICGYSDDRDVTKAEIEGDPRAILAHDMLSYQIAKYIGSYIAALGGVDAIVFTGGIGENSSYMRKLVMSDMECFGVDFDFEENEKRVDGVHYLSTEKSKVKVMVIPTNEELSIARETRDLVQAAQK